MTADIRNYGSVWRDVSENIHVQHDVVGVLGRDFIDLFELTQSRPLWRGRVRPTAEESVEDIARGWAHAIVERGARPIPCTTCKAPAASATYQCRRCGEDNPHTEDEARIQRRTRQRHAEITVGMRRS